MLIRAALPEDAVGIAEVHVGSWRTTYRGLLPDSVLAAQSVEQRAAIWREAAEAVERGESRSFVLVAEDPVDGIIGFASAGPEREQGVGFDGELYAISLLEGHQGRGVGRRLVARVVDLLLEQGHSSMRVWVLEGNPAQGFYERLGGARVGTKALIVAQESFVEVAYGWPDLWGLQGLWQAADNRKGD